MLNINEVHTVFRKLSDMAVGHSLGSGSDLAKGLYFKICYCIGPLVTQHRTFKFGSEQFGLILREKCIDKEAFNYTIFNYS